MFLWNSLPGLKSKTYLDFIRRKIHYRLFLVLPSRRVGKEQKMIFTGKLLSLQELKWQIPTHNATQLWSNISCIYILKKTYWCGSFPSFNGSWNMLQNFSRNIDDYLGNTDDNAKFLNHRKYPFENTILSSTFKKRFNQSTIQSLVTNKLSGRMYYFVTRKVTYVPDTVWASFPEILKWVFLKKAPVDFKLDTTSVLMPQRHSTECLSILTSQNQKDFTMSPWSQSI